MVENAPWFAHRVYCTLLLNRQLTLNMSNIVFKGHRGPFAMYSHTRGVAQ